MLGLQRLLLACIGNSCCMNILNALGMTVVLLRHQNPTTFSHAKASSFPLPSAWRGNKSDAILFGRSRCQAVLRPPHLGAESIPSGFRLVHLKEKTLVV